MNFLTAIKNGIAGALRYVGDVHSESNTAALPSWMRWAATIVIVGVVFVIIHSELKHLPLDPTLCSFMQWLTGAVLGSGVARKLWGENGPTPPPPQ
jgi:hypothetical protein